ncbi:MAG: DUF1571 domain-containing protein [Planctomycetota bacterium]
MNTATRHGCLLAAIACHAMLAGPANGESAKLLEASAREKTPLTDDQNEPASQHPLEPVLAMAQEAYDRIGAEVQDYTCRIIRRERLGGKLRPYEFMRAKIRHELPLDESNEAASGDNAATPFSVYLQFEKPRALAGREVLFVEGRNAGRMLVRRGGTRLAYVTTYLSPDSPLAVKESRYPITDVGFHRLIGRLIEVVKEDLEHDECRVQFFEGAKIGDRVCTRVLVEHPTQRDHFRYHRAIIFIDTDRQIPLGYASYTWSDKPGGKPVLVEEYLYTDVKLNVGLTDDDFDRDNPAYGFLKRDAVVAKD